MAINEIKVNTATLKNDADQIGQKIAAMEKQLESMHTSITQLNSMWEGPTKTAFAAVFENDRKAALQVIKELKSLNSYENMAKDKYNQCEKKIEEIVASIRV